MENIETKKKKSVKDKPLYSIWQNIVFTISNIWKWDKLLVFLCIAQAPLKVILQLSGLYILKLGISLIENNSDAVMFIVQISAFSVIVLFLNIISNKLSAKIQWRQYKIRFNYINMVNYKNMDADYENIENPDGMNKMQMAFQTVNNENSATQNIVNILVYTATSIISIVTVCAIISTLNPLLLIAVTAVLLGQYSVNNACHRWHYKNTDKWVRHDRELNYINNISGDFDRAKDIRLYNLTPWLHDIFKSVLCKRVKWYKKAEQTSFTYYDVGQAIQMLLSNVLTIGYIIINVLNKSISIADAIFFISAIGEYAGIIMDVFNSISQLNAASLSICHLREFLDMPDKSNRSKGINLPGTAVEIEFENVSFVYPKSEKNVLDNISFSIKKGEKIAIVGLNGAGKTTLVKLISGLYRPTEGNITINGNNVTQYNRDEYYTLISAVFQDIYFYPVSIAQNIALCEENKINYNKLLQTIRFAGLQDKIDSLPDGYNTFLIKSVIDNAIELSGGEKQKLALARALYKGGSLLILDEPTAALDPIAENEMYLKYNDFSEDKTSIFISHRLSSTRFCDRIFFLDDGKIIESGSHNELMSQNGRYAEIFNIQSYYYKEEVSGGKA